MQPLPRPRAGQHNKPGHVRVDVAYADGSSLSFIFPRSTRIPDLNAQIARAGRVQKVILQ
ncbi:hypothetical protein [Acidithiobacillus acidisediminis]|uniref:hypothetical protein n=1 Tax=Acidithiobacillus acidisediminis TaxID=2937799 RepID=UPI00201059F0|nr:hypothetical protein [Acidithiobacillus sp. S30A2]